MTLRPLIAALIGTAALPAIALAQQAAAPPAPVLVDARVAALRDAALKDDYAWSIVEGLTTEVGQRLAGTAQEALARDWAVRRLTSLGFANVHVEPFELPVWTRGYEVAHLIAPFPQELKVTALGGSASTSREGIVADLVYFDSLDALRAAPDSAVAGKIVFVDHRMTATQDGSSYGPGGQPRRAGPTVASLKGAAAILVRSAGTDHHRHPHTGNTGFQNGARPIPAGAVSVIDAEQIVRVMKRGQPMRVHLSLVSKTVPGTSGNVVAEVPGRDPSLPPVLVGGHLDSWDLGTGAIDDGAGVAIAAAAAKRIMDAGRPLRTIKIVWFGAEEVGLFGGIAWNKAHPGPYHAIAESDFGADRIWRVTSKLGAAREGEARMLAAALAPLGIAQGAFDQAEGSDITPMLAAGVPGVGLSQDGTRYFDIHHTADDTLDKVDPEALRQNVAAWTAMLAVLAGPIEPKAAEPKPRKKR